MHTLLVFDLDGTLAAIGKGILQENLEKLYQLEEKGYRIAVCSGKPVYYLCGFFRQAGLAEPILIGENGAVFQMGVELPPEYYRVYPYAREAEKQIGHFREILDREIPDLYYQPNEVVLTPFPAGEKEFDRIEELIRENQEELTELLVYRHADSFDFVPRDINKKNGLAYLSALTGITSGETIAIGDGVNDLPMFDYADISIGIGPMDPEKTDLHYATIGMALEDILRQLL